MDEGCQWPGEVRYLKSARFAAQKSTYEIHRLVVSRILTSLVRECLLSPVQSIIPRCCPGLRSEIEIVDFRLATPLNLAVLSAGALCRGLILLQHESVGTESGSQN
jgi:hypothetical protein